MISVAMLSKWHVHATDYASQAKENPNVSIQVVWDEDPDRGQAWAKELGVPFEGDLSAVLNDPEIDGVIVDTPTNLHKEVIIEAAKHGKHIFTEKVLGLTVAECREILTAIHQAGVQLMVSLPRLTESYYLYAQEVLDRGLLGELTSIRCRLAHNGAVPSENHSKGWLPEHFFDSAQCGGGALIDLGAHPIYLTNRLAGKANAVTARLTSYLERGVDDNAAVLVEYESGALGVLEAGFVASGSPFSLSLYGTKGTLMIEDDRILLKSEEADQDGLIPADKLPSPLAMPMEQWVNAIRNENAPTLQEEDFVRLTEINEAAALSSREGRQVVLSQEQG